MIRRATLARLAAGLFVCAAATGATAQTHPSQLPRLSPDAVFPRCSEAQLEVAGFPDHKHEQHWTTWETPRDASGREYGPGTLCVGGNLQSHPELHGGAGELAFRGVVMRFNPGYAPCDMAPFLELMDWARHEVADVLSLATDDTLLVVNPDNTAAYTEQTGQGVWRLYRFADDHVVIEPYPVLMARTLDGHAAFMLATDWVLRRALPADLPPWLHQGLVEYVGEDGAHLVNYMGEFRKQGDVLFSPPLTDAILARGVDPDQGADRENFRRACYSAFLMVWQLVEFEGGLVPLQDFLAQAAAGADLDDAARGAWGVDLATLADLVDPARNGEPAGGRMRRQTPHQQP